MPLQKLSTEFELNSSPRLLYQYLSTSDGLKEWFCEDAIELPDERIKLIWDGEEHIAKVLHKQPNQHVRYEFETKIETDNGFEHPYMDFTLEFNEMTQSTFLIIEDYNEETDQSQQQNLWEQLMEFLRERIGAKA